MSMNGFHVRVGDDAAWGVGRLTPAALRAAGASFVVGYVSPDPSKNLPIAAARELHAAGIGLVLVWESGAKRCFSRHWGGVADATEATHQADAIAHALGFPSWPMIYFAPADFDAAPSDQGAINEYLAGVAEHRGPLRAGAYLGYWPLERARAASTGITYWWQTYAWSGGKVHPDASLYQYSNSHTLNGVSVDYNKALKPDFGQLEREAPHPPTEPHQTDRVRVAVELAFDPRNGRWHAGVADVQPLPHGTA